MKAGGDAIVMKLLSILKNATDVCSESLYFLQTKLIQEKHDSCQCNMLPLWFRTSLKGLSVQIHYSFSRFTDTVNKDTEPKDPFPIPRKIMAEPDYIDDDNPELIRPQKLINPVKSSRNHQDLHRELLMNQKR